MADQNRIKESPLLQRVADFSGGLNTRVFPTEIADNQAVKLQNLDASDPGQLKKRDGTVQFGTSMNASLPVRGGIDFNPDDASIHELLWAVSNEVHGMDSSGTTNLRATLPTSNLKTEMIQALNKVIISNGTDRPIVMDTSFAVSTISSLATAIPIFTTSVYAKNRIFTNDVANPTYVHYSEILEDVFNQSTNVFKFSEGEGDAEIVKLKQFRNDELLVFMKSRVEELIIAGTPGSDWSRRVIDDRFGCGAGETVQEVGGVVYFLDQDKRVRALARTALDAVQGTQAVPISDLIQPDLDTISDANIGKSTAGVFRDWYMIAVPVDSTEPDTMYAFNVTTKAWSGPWTLGANKFLESEVENQGNRIYIGDQSVGDVFQMFAEVNADDGNAIECILETKRYNWGRPESEKTFNEAEFEILGASSGSLTIEAQVNVGGYTPVESSPFTLGGAGPALPVSLPFGLASSGIQYVKTHMEEFARGRDIQYRLTHNTSDSDFQMVAMRPTALDENYESENM